MTTAVYHAVIMVRDRVLAQDLLNCKKNLSAKWSTFHVLAALCHTYSDVICLLFLTFRVDDWLCNA